ncbi:fimbria/pilus outer membrane usher protein [Pantoea sp. 1.19]|uniref:fimbria/pilus outer membrane usher protein n=1 Tax=Pantoea sp. 1.19 TaxID=1925589 RepID=UPI00210F50E4|nr:fimbria/pilus outer membrane usher protein [Pantoea sp. 1.19]
MLPGGRQQQHRDYRQASLRWRNPQLEAGAGTYGDSNARVDWGELTGSVVLMDGHAFAANQVNDALVLVKTGWPGVGVRYENQRVGTTDSNGYLLVPRINAWYPARYEIDALDLPANLTVATTEQRLAVRRQSGYLLNFPVQPLHAASIILHDSRGQPLPVSTQIIRPGRPTGYVGWDGLVWMETLSTNNPFEAITPDGERCHGRFVLPAGTSPTLTPYGPLTCSPGALP